jgi:O-antigen/teichoic acid export membrane protein
MGLKELIINNRFIKDVLTLISGSAIAQIIGFAFMPVLTRLFSPEEFGIFYIFLTTASILSLLITGGYEKSLVLPSSDKDAWHLLLFAIILSILATTLSLIILLFLNNWGNVFFQTRNSQLILWLIPVYSFLFGIFRILQNWSIRRKKYNHVSGSNILRTCATSGLQTGFGLFQTGSFGLVMGSCISQLFPLWFLMLKDKETFGKITRESIKTAYLKGKEYKDFPVYKMPSDLINEVSIQLPLFILKIFFSNAIAGIYSLPQKIMSQPSKLIGQAAGEVYYRQASELNARQQDLSEVTFNTFKVLFLIGVLPFTIIFLWGPEIFSFVFSSQWEFSGRIAAYLSPWLLFVFSGSPISYIFLIRQKLRLSLVLNMSLLFIRFAALLAGSLIIKNLEITIILFAGASFVYWVLISFYSLFLGGIKLRRSLLFILGVLIISSLPLCLIKLFLL